MERRGFDAAAADRRRDHQPPAHRGEDRAGVRAADGPRARRLARGRRGGEPARRRAARRASTRENRASRSALRDVYAQQAARARCCRYADARARPRCDRLARRATSPQPAFLGPPRARRRPARRARRRTSTGRFFFTAWELQGQVPEDPRRPDVRRGGARAVRRRAARCSSAIVDEKLLRAARRLRLLAGAQRRRRHRALRATRRARAELARFPMLRQQAAQGRRQAVPRRSPTSSRPLESGVADYLGAFAVTAGHRRRRAGRALRGASTTTTTRSWSRRSPTGWPRPSPSGCTQRARREWGYGARRAAHARRPDRREVPRHPPGVRLPGLPRPHREAHALRRCSTRRALGHHAHRELRDAAGRERQRPLLRPSRRRATSPSAASAATRSRTTPRARAMPLAEVERWLAPNLGYEPEVRA